MDGPTFKLVMDNISPANLTAAMPYAPFHVECWCGENVRYVGRDDATHLLSLKDDPDEAVRFTDENEAKRRIRRAVANAEFGFDSAHIAW